MLLTLMNQLPVLADSVLEWHDMFMYDILFLYLLNFQLVSMVLYF